MTLTETWIPKAPPLREDEAGNVRVGDTGVSLELLLNEYFSGSSAEEIAGAYESVGLANVYAVISYYLQNRDAVDAYLATKAEQAKQIRTEIESRSPYAPFREKLLARLEQRKGRQK